MVSRTKAWDHLYEETRMTHKLGYQEDESKIPLERQHIRSALDILYGAKLTVEQIGALEDVMYYSYIIGRDMK